MKCPLVRNAHLDALTIPTERDKLVVCGEDSREPVIGIIREASLTAKQSVNRRSTCGTTSAYALNKGRKCIRVHAFIVRKSGQLAIARIKAVERGCE